MFSSAIAMFIYIGLLVVLIPSTYEIHDDKKKKKRDSGRTGAKGQVYEASIDAKASVDARPRKTGGPIRGKKVIPWKQ